MHKYPWRCLNTLKNVWINFWLSQSSEYARSSYMFDRVLKMSLVLNKPGFWIWHSFIEKGYAEFRVCLIMAPYASIMPEYALMSLNMPENGWILLNAPEYAWKYLNKLFNIRGLNMLQYIHNNIIIIVNNVILLEFLSAVFVHPGTLLPFYVFFNMS